MLKEFVSQFGLDFFLDERKVVDVKGTYFLMNKKMQLMEKAIFRGLFLGQIKQQRFVPSLPLLEQIAKKTDRFVIVNDKAAWLFVCNKKIIHSSIEDKGDVKIGNPVIVMNARKEPLGFGIYKEKDISNRFNIGDFLKRESK